MFKYLSAADAAIIWREQGITNKVASPVKFSEYVCCGLPIITNDSIDLVTNYIKRNNCGKILNSMDLIEDKIIVKLSAKDEIALTTILNSINNLVTIHKKTKKLIKTIH